MSQDADPTRSEHWSFQHLLDVVTFHNARPGASERHERDRWRKRINYDFKRGKLRAIAPSKSVVDAVFARRDIDLWALPAGVSIGERPKHQQAVLHESMRAKVALSGVSIPPTERLRDAYRELAEQAEMLRAENELMRPVYETQKRREIEISRKTKGKKKPRTR